MITMNTLGVRASFIAGHDADPGYLGGVFDKWLEEHDRRVAQAERERIVKEIDASPVVLWAGKGGAKERILEL